MTMTMFYVHGIGEKKDCHINIPAHNAQEAYDVFKAELGQKVTVAQISPLFEFEFTDDVKPSLVLN
jgi:hypothetical protein